MAHDPKSHASKPHAAHEKTAADRLHESLETAKTKAADAVAHSREVASETAHKAATKLEANPLGVLVGGLAVGAVVGALIPRSAKEQQALAPLGRKLGETARSAISAAREAGYAELDQRGLTKHAAKDQVRGIVDGIGQAVKNAGSAAAKTAAHTDA